ncbi:hypothetical protein E2493_16830 [Sphingomonas parva]|uniref:Uncharacterized protein n=1 Tax=Sphingomonas parva TaxID=2555898 RepID=A0A4Y8ZPN3_9SPHN|nr:hypothetical protein [Sphingomonas parva]TFI57095.1 hypothetical protein E2493_16830 [Sphingomonas parva]
MRPRHDATTELGRSARGRLLLATEPELLLAGQRMLAPAAALLARLQAPLLTVSRCSADAEATVRLSSWTRFLEPGEEIGDAGGALAELREAGAEALREVARRWPPYATPPIIGLVTDGIGLAVSGEHPSGLSRNWLLDQIERRSSASIIIPFGTSGVWSLLASDMQGPGRAAH